MGVYPPNNYQSAIFPSLYVFTFSSLPFLVPPFSSLSYTSAPTPKYAMSNNSIKLIVTDAHG